MYNNKNINKLKIGFALQTALLIRQVNNKALSRKINKHQTVISDILRGKIELKASSLYDILKTLDFNIDEFNKLIKIIEDNYKEDFKI